MNEGKGKEKNEERGGRKEERRKKSNGCTLSFCNGCFRKKLLDAKGLFGGNVFKNPAKVTRVKLLRTYTRKNYAVVEIHPYTRSSFVKTLIVKSFEQ